MKSLVIGGLLVASLFAVVPASAQVTVRAGSHGVVVRDHADRGQHRGWRNHRASCRTVTTRSHRPNGTVVISKRRVC